MNKTVLMIGLDFSVKGGMTTVIELYKNYGLFEKEAIFIPSYKKAGRLCPILFFLRFLFLYLHILFFNKSIKIIHIHCSHKGSFFRKTIVLYIAKMFNKKTIFHIHGGQFSVFTKSFPFSLAKSIITKLQSYVFKTADRVLVVSDYWYNLYKNECKTLKVLYNPIKIYERQEKIKQISKVKILFMGKICENKGVYDILKAAKIIKNSNLEILFYGNGEVKKFQKTIKENNITKKIKVKGWINREETEKAYNEGDILLLPSYYESFGLAALEAMTYQLPVIASNTGGIPSLVKDGINGYLIQPGDYKALAEKIDVLTDNPELRQKMGQEGYRIAKEKFDVNIILKQLEEIYKELLY